MQITIDQTEYEILIQSTKKQQISLNISAEGLITVLAPKKCTQEEITSFIIKNKNTIKKAKERQDNKIILRAVKQHEEDEYYLYLGKPHKLSDLPLSKEDTTNTISIRLKQFYTKETKKILSERIAYYEPIIKVSSKSFTVTDCSKTWGTCDSNKKLTFNYRLSMAPLPVIDYVVIHELCHIYHMNHDRSFYRKVGTYDKEYKAHEAYLARLGAFMSI